MPDRKKHATRVIVVSDLHLGGEPPVMMSRPGLLGSFIEELRAQGRGAGEEELELVIAGDFVDFLAIEPHASFTADPALARDKLVSTMAKSSPFGRVFDALGEHVAAGHRLTVLVGNHDVELALPQVQAAFLERLGASPHEVLFVDDGRAYRVGGALIEHGNRYDSANVNDWTGLRAIASALSREEAPNVELRVSAGSKLVAGVVNPIKKSYPFIDLLQPQGELLALLLLALEPELRWEWDKVARLLRAQRLEQKNAGGLQPGATREVAYSPLEREDPELRQVFGEAYAELRRSGQEVGVKEWASILFTPKENGLAAIFTRDGEVPRERLQPIRTVMQKLLLSDTSDRLDGPAGQYGEAAKRLIEAGKGVEVVVMGHTHLPRQLTLGGGRYLNTGTWVDRFRVPAAALADGADQELQAFLRSLWKDERSPLPPTYGELLVSSEGQVTLAEIREVSA